MSSSGFISSKKWQSLTNDLLKLGCRESDLKEEFVQASSKGGQKVNKTSSAVRLYYQKDMKQFFSERFRAQDQNRYEARKKLLTYLEEKQFGKHSKQYLVAMKKKKQKARRKRKTASKLAHLDSS